MWITDEITLLSLAGPSSVTVGAFDGVHRGHQALISDLTEHAREAEMRAVVVTFDPLPLQFFAQPHGVLLTSVEERVAYLERLGVDGVVVLTFDQALADTSAYDFITLMLRHLNMVHLWIGPDFALGRGRGGDADALRKMGKARGFAVHTMSNFYWQGMAVRSTRIRDLLQAGDVELATALLGHPYRLTGAVSRPAAPDNGAAGRPLVEVRVPVARLLPAPGAYVCQVQQEKQVGAAVAYIGEGAAVEVDARQIDVYPLSETHTLSPGTLTLNLFERLHSSARPASTAVSTAQMRKDEAEALRWLETARTSVSLE